MSVMSELHSDLTTIHQILLGQRKVAQEQWSNTHVHHPLKLRLGGKIECIDDLLLEIEAAGVKWPDDVTEPCQCDGDIHPEHGPWG